MRTESSTISAAYTLSFMSAFWDRLTAVQSAPPGWVVGVGALAALFAVWPGQTWRISRIAITIAHEGGHALASVLSGRRLEGIRLHADTSGSTVTRGKRDGLGLVLTALAGYLTPPVLGAGAAALLATHRVTLLLWLVLALLALVLLVIRNWYGVLALLVTAGAVFAVTWLAAATTRAVFGYAVAWFLLFGGVRPVFELARSRGRARRRGRPTGSDADQLAALTGVPGGLWVLLFALVAVAAVVFGARLLVPWPIPVAVPRAR
jgi:hypothetical protein